MRQCRGELYTVILSSGRGRARRGTRRGVGGGTFSGRRLQEKRASRIELGLCVAHSLSERVCVRVAVELGESGQAGEMTLPGGGERRAGGTSERRDSSSRRRRSRGSQSCSTRALGSPGSWA